MLNRLEELAWISRCKLFRDENAFASLVGAWSGRIRKFLLMQTGGDVMLSDDLAQETFIRVWNRIPELHRAGDFPGWIFRISYHLWIDHVRCMRLSEPMEKISVPDRTSASDELEGRELRNVLMEALGQLNDQERTTVTLFYLSELSIKEIMEVTGMSEGTVKSQLSRGRAKLRQLPELKRYYNER